MDTFHPISKEKIRLKKIARKIRDIKNDLHYKGVIPNITGKSAAELQKQLAFMKYVFRHRHIAYCMVRGNPMQKIESAKRPNKRSWNLIDTFRIELYEQSLQFYRNMVQDLLDEHKTKDREIFKFLMVEHVWDMFLHDDRDITESMIALMDVMHFILYEDMEDPALEFPSRELIEAPEDIIELTDEVDFVGTEDGIIISAIKPECYECHQGNGMCSCEASACIPIIMSDPDDSNALECLNCFCDVCVGNCLCKECRELCSPQGCDNYYTSIPCKCTPRSDCTYPRIFHKCIIRTGKAAQDGPDLKELHGRFESAIDLASYNAHETNGFRLQFEQNRERAGFPIDPCPFQGEYFNTDFVCDTEGGTICNQSDYRKCSLYIKNI